MDEITRGRYRDKLRKRRDQVAMTLQHIVKEQRHAERNTDWLDQAAYESRIQLLDRLNHWYIAEIDEIDKALDRITTNHYGHCLACHSPIDSERLEISPEAVFCGSCQEMREGLQRI